MSFRKRWANINATRPPNECPTRTYGGSHTGAVKQRSQFVGGPACGPRHGTGVAPAEACAIVAAGARELRKLGLHERPTERRPTERGVQDDGRRSFAGAVHVQPETTDVDEPARRGNDTHRLSIRLRMMAVSLKRRHPR